MVTALSLAGALSTTAADFEVEATCCPGFSDLTAFSKRSTRTGLFPVLSRPLAASSSRSS